MRTRRKAKRRTPRRRTFVLQVYNAVHLAGTARFEEEGKILDTCARTICDLLQLEHDCCTVRHDQRTFNVYVGPKDQRALLVKERHESPLEWSSAERAMWCEDVANEWLEQSGPPRRVGNRLPRPVGTRTRETPTTLSPRGADGQA